MTDYQIIHRFIPASPIGKHSDKTACGIKLVRLAADSNIAIAEDGGRIMVSHKGQPFDCKRCRSVLELSHNRKMAA